MMNLFEDWYITYCKTHPADFEETFRLDDKGEYYHKQLFWMHKAFLAGQVLCEGGSQMKYYQAVYQTDAHGFNVVYSKNIWTTEADAREYLYELAHIMGEDFMYTSWVTELFVDTP